MPPVLSRATVVTMAVIVIPWPGDGRNRRSGRAASPVSGGLAPGSRVTTAAIWSSAAGCAARGHRPGPSGVALRTSPQLPAGARNTVAPLRLAAIIFSWMPPIGPTLPSRVDRPGAGDEAAVGQVGGADLVHDPEREHQPGRRAADLVAQAEVDRERREAAVGDGDAERPPLRPCSGGAELHRHRRRLAPCRRHARPAPSCPASCAASTAVSAVGGGRRLRRRRSRARRRAAACRCDGAVARARSMTPKPLG